jgi:hypothetical protein
VERWAISLEDVVIDPLGVQVRDSLTREGRKRRDKTKRRDRL